MLNNYMPECDDLNIAGVEVDVYFTCADELANDPKSKNKLATPITTAGASNQIGEVHTFLTTPVGAGYFRKMRVITNTGEIDTKGSIKDGTTKIDNKFKFKLKGFGAVEKEFAEKVSACCGMVLLITDLSGVTHEFGRRSTPAVVASFTGGTGGDFRGFSYELDYMGRTPRTIDLVAFPPDLTPN
jgi:hypothetical protein